MDVGNSTAAYAVALQQGLARQQVGYSGLKQAAEAQASIVTAIEQSTSAVAAAGTGGSGAGQGVDILA